MAQRKVIWSFNAKSERDEMLEYWNDRNKSTTFSKKLRLDIVEKTSTLKTQAFAGKSISKSDFRILIFENYNLVHKITETQIQILSIWENHQNPKKLKNKLGL